MDSIDPFHQVVSVRFARAVGALGIAFGLLGLIAGAFAIPCPGGARALILLGASVLLAAQGNDSRRSGLSRFLGACAGLLGLYEALVFSSLISPVFWLAIALLGAGLALLLARLAAISAVIFLLSVLGALFGIDSPYLATRGMNAPPGPAALFLLLSLGAIAARPQGRLMGALLDRGAAGRLTRRLLPPAILLPILLGVAKASAIRAGWSGAGLGPAMVASLVVLFTGIIWAAARSVGAEEGARRRAEDRLRGVAEYSPAPICLKDAQDRYLFVNRKMEEVAGRPEAEILGRTPHELFRPEVADLLRKHDMEVLEKGKAIEVEEFVGLPGREKFFLSVKFPVFDGEGRAEAVGVVAAEITEQKRLENELKKSKAEVEALLKEKSSQLEQTSAQLLQAQKMEAVGRLAGGVAHDFNNILTAIGGFTELLLGSLETDDPRREDVLEIRKAGQRAAALTRQLLAFSRRQILQPRTLDLNALVADVQKMLKRLLAEDVELVFYPGEDAGFVHADPGQLEQVLMNLAVNSRDAMPKGGRLAISTARVVLDDDFVGANPGAKAGAHALLSVTDTGVGMDARVLEHLFEPFFTTKEKGKGTGLGLSTVYGIVKQSGGFIKVESEVGQGTAVRIFLPCAERPSDGERPIEPARVEGGRETILLVDDDESVLKPIGRFLEQSGYRVIMAGSGEEALRKAEQHRGEIRLLVTDLVMPRLGGIELSKRLSILRPELRCLYMTGYSEEKLDPNRPLLQKPVTLEALAQKVRQTLDKA